MCVHQSSCLSHFLFELIRPSINFTLYESKITADVGREYILRGHNRPGSAYHVCTSTSRSFRLVCGSVF